MKRVVINDKTGEPIRIEDAEPVCDKDLCASCGECLACYQNMECWRSKTAGNKHLWVIRETPGGEK